MYDVSTYSRNRKLVVAGSKPARADQLAFTLRDKLGEVWKGTTVLVSEPQKTEE